MSGYGQILAERGGHKIIDDTTAYGKTDYHFWGFIPHDDTTLTALKVGTQDVVDTGVTYKAGIYYGAPFLADENRGWYTEITLATGAVTLILTRESPKKY